MTVYTFNHVPEEVVDARVGLRHDRAYLLSVGDARLFESSLLLARELGPRYGKPVDVIPVLSHPLPGWDGNYIVVNADLAQEKRTSGEAVFQDKDVRQAQKEVTGSDFVHSVIDDVLREQSDILVNVFKHTSSLGLGDGYRVHVIGPSSSLVDHYDRKSVQVELAGQLGLPRPATQTADTLDELVEMYRRREQPHAFVAYDVACGGKGSFVVRSEEDLHALDRRRAPYVLSDLVDVVASPSTVGIVDGQGRVFSAALNDQILDGTLFRGAAYPSTTPEAAQGRMREMVRDVGRHLGAKGYRGMFGVDFMVSRGGDVFFVEINPRKTGSSAETMHAYRVQNPGRPSLAKLEFDAVFREGWRLPSYEVPDMSWALSTCHAMEGQTLQGQRVADERMLFDRGGQGVLDHPGSVRITDSSRVARVVVVGEKSQAGHVRTQALEAADLVSSTFL